jgi:hypothetical protein
MKNILTKNLRCLRQNGVGASKTCADAAILGHERRDQTATYTHVKLEKMRRGVEVLEKHCREIDGFFQNCDDSQVNAQAFRQSAGK